MQHNKQLVLTTIVLSLFLLGIPALTARANASAANPCKGCQIVILAPGSGGALNNNQTVGPSFLVSFFVKNLTLRQPGTSGVGPTGGDVNTTSAGVNYGHIHVWVDNAYDTVWASPNGIPMSLSPGTHTIRLQLVNDFHVAFSPDLNASTTVKVTDTLSQVQSTANTAQTNAGNAMYYSLGALIVSIISLILVAYVAFKPKSKTP